MTFSLGIQMKTQDRPLNRMERTHTSSGQVTKQEMVYNNVALLDFIQQRIKSEM